jgi:hypothetical protein
MWMKSDGLERQAWSAAMLCIIAAVVCASGCKKKEQPTEEKATGGIKLPSEAAALGPDAVARVHWAGKKRVAGDPNSSALMSIWKMPESERVLAQTLDKLAIAPWHPWTTNSAPITNYSELVSNLAPASSLRPLLDDLVQEESYLEIRKPAGQSAEIVLAVRLANQRAALWASNLATITTSHQWPFAGSIESFRSGDWTFVGLLQDPKSTNALLGEWRTRAAAGNFHPPTSGGATNSWLETDLDLKGLSDVFALDWKLPQNSPKISIAINGEGGNVHTKARCNFPEPLRIVLDEWTVPTNVMHDPLTSFTAIRGIGTWLGSLKAWNDWQMGPAPNQVYFWAQGSMPVLTYCAAAVPDPASEVRRVTELLMEKANLYLTTNGMGTLEPKTNTPGMAWMGVPFATPFIESTVPSGGGFILGGLNPIAGNTNLEAPASLLAQFSGRTNLVYYNWELTGQRLQSLLYISQLFRMVCGKAQLTTNEATIGWLKSAPALFGNSATMGAQTGPNQLSFTRVSTVGLTGAEIHLLADWLESPHFPSGLYTFLTPPPSPHQRQRPPRTPRPPGAATNVAPGAVLPLTPTPAQPTKP